MISLGLRGGFLFASSFHLVSPGDLVLLLLFPNSLSPLCGLYPHAVAQGPVLLSSLSLIPSGRILFLLRGSQWLGS